MVEKINCSQARIDSTLQTPHTVLYHNRAIDFTRTDYIPEEDSVLRLDVENREKLFAELSRVLSGSYDPSPEEILEKLWEREEIQNTYLGNGVAAPHLLSRNLSHTECRLVLLEHPIPYAEGGEEARVLLLIAGPLEDRQVHLQLTGKFQNHLLSGDDLSPVSHERAETVFQSFLEQ